MANDLIQVFNLAPTEANCYDAMQRKMIAIACLVTCGPEEDSVQHAVPEARHASQLA